MDEWSNYESVVTKRWEYYRPRFERFARGKWLSWNWAAFFATLAWLRYRRLYKWSWAYFFVSAPFLLAVLFAGYPHDSCERALDPASGLVFSVTVLALLCLGWVIPPLVANYLYFNHVRALIGKKGGGTRANGAFGALMLQVLALIIPALAVPSYAFYEYRYMVSNGLALAGNAKVAVQEYLNERQRLPTQIDDVTKETSNRYVDRLVLESDGTIRVIFGDESKKLSGHSVSLVPAKKEGQTIHWVCRSKDLPDRCLPISCRQP